MDHEEGSDDASSGAVVGKSKWSKCASSTKYSHTVPELQPNYILMQNNILSEFGCYCQFLLIITKNLYSSRWNFESHKKWHSAKIVCELFQRKMDTKVIPFRQSKNLLLTWLKILIRHWHDEEYIHLLCDMTCFDLENVTYDIVTFDPTSTGPGGGIQQENFTDLKEIKYFMLFFRLISLDTKLYLKQRMLANNIYNILKCRYTNKITFKFINSEIKSMLIHFNGKLNELMKQ
jgi:hypothetical protein